MSTPETPPPPQPPPPAPAAPATPPPSVAPPVAPKKRWYQYAAPIVMGLFCVELGILLVLLPWLDVYERDVYLYLPEKWWPIVLSSAMRAGVSAVGFLNFLVALSEFLEMAAPAKKSDDASNGDASGRAS